MIAKLASKIIVKRDICHSTQTPVALTIYGDILSGLPIAQAARIAGGGLSVLPASIGITDIESRIWRQFVERMIG
jgi:hypothetical protein